MTVLHKDLTGGDLHVAGYVTGTDPGTVGAGLIWVDTSGGTGSWAIKIRNATNTAWEAATSAGTPTTISMGDPTADGSWQIIVSGTELQFNRRESGAWVNKGTVTA